MKDTNRIDHFGWAVYPENLDRYVKQLGDLFDTTFDELEKYGVKMFVSWEAGVEISAPIGEGENGDMLRTFLAEHGEGPLAIVFRVPDVDAATERAGKQGWPIDPGTMGDEESDALWKQVTRVRERFVGPFLGTLLLFGEIDYAESD